jgi:dUTP pyrophosphatase
MRPDTAMATIRIPITREAGTEDLPLPRYQTPGSSGLDLHCAEAEPVVLGPGERRLVSTGISLALPPGYEAQVRPRSGLALKHGVTLVNSPGTIDSDYRGVVSLILINLGAESFTVTRGMRLAQLVIHRVVRAELEAVETLDATGRAGGGFGHTGTGIRHGGH